MARLDRSLFVIVAGAIEPISSSSATSVSESLDRNYMTSHFTVLVRTSFAIIRQLRSVSRSLTKHATSHLVQRLILNSIDYCNVVYALSPTRSIIRLRAFITLLHRDVRSQTTQWLRIGERIEFKL